MKIKNPFILTLGAALMLASCGQQNQSSNGALSSSAAEKVYVAPGEQDEYYAFLSGGYSGKPYRVRVAFWTNVQGNSCFFPIPNIRIRIFRRNQTYAQHLSWFCAMG